MEDCKELHELYLEGQLQGGLSFTDVQDFFKGLCGDGCKRRKSPAFVEPTTSVAEQLDEALDQKTIHSFPQLVEVIKPMAEQKGVEDLQTTLMELNRPELSVQQARNLLPTLDQAAMKAYNKLFFQLSKFQKQYLVKGILKLE